MELACPYCTGRFEVAPTGESRPATCPHCRRPVTVPATPPAPPRVEREVAVPAEAIPPPAATDNSRHGEVVVLRRRSPAERARYRRRVSLIWAVGGLVALVTTLAVLLRVRP